MKRILVAGGGLIGRRHCAAVAAHAGCVLAGLVDPDPSVEAEAQRYADLAQAPDDIDAVIIAAPTALHSRLGEEAAARGWHMLIEKPVTATLEEARTLADTIARTRVAALVGHHRRYHAPVRQLKDLLAKDAIGTPVTTTLIWAMRKPESYFEGNWRAAGGSPVFINIVHDIDLLRFLLGEISAVAALRGTSLRQSGRVESGTVALSFACGATGAIAFADTAASPWGFEAATGENPDIGTTHQDMLWITGTRGGIGFPSMQMWCGTDWSHAAIQRPVKRAQNAKPPLDAQLDHFLDVMDGQPPLCSLADATRTLRVTLEVERQLSTQTVDCAHPEFV